MTRSSSMKLVSATTSTSGKRGLDLGRGGDPVHHRHQQVHQHDVGRERLDRVAPPARPSSASPTTSMSSRSSKNPRRPRRTTAWSSTSRTRIRAGASVPPGRAEEPSIRREHSLRGNPRDGVPAGGRPDAQGRRRDRDRRRRSDSVAAARPASASSARSASSASLGVRARAAGPEPDRGERHPDLAEHLDRHEEAGEQEHDAQELAQLEQLGGPGPVERVGDRREERAERDQDRRRHARVEAAGERARANAAGSDATRLTRIATGAISRLNRNWSPGWFGSREYGSTRRLGMNT